MRQMDDGASYANGLEHEEDKCLKLKHAIYGLVLAAHWQKLAVGILQSTGFVGGCDDPCLMTRRNENGIVFSWQFG
jgi:hypothetical protein